MACVRWPLAALCLIRATAAAQRPQQQPQSTWPQLPRMQLERQFAGPIYLPITARRSPPGPAGFVQYGANILGSVSCVVPAASAGRAGGAAGVEEDVTAHKHKSDEPKSGEPWALDLD
jgi:hypothetical protein